MKTSKLLLLLTATSLGIASQAHAGSATWSGGSTGVWNSNGNWTDSSGSGFPNSTTDTAGFTSAAAITSLGQAINVGSLSLATGNYAVTITDASNTLTSNGSISTAATSGQSLTLNVNTTLAVGTSISAGAGSTITFGSGTLALGNAIQTLTGGGTINLNNTISGGGSTAELLLTQGVTVNLAGSLSGTYNSNGAAFIQSTNGTASTLNLVAGTGKKIQLGKSGTIEKGNLFITTSGGTQSGVVLVSGPGTALGTAAQTVFTIGANIVGGGTAIYNPASFSINNVTSTSAETVILYANSGTTCSFNTSIGGMTGDTGTLLQISGGGTIVFGGSSADAYSTSTAANGTEVMNSTNLQLNDSGGVGLTGNTTVDSGSSVQLTATGQMTAGTLTINGAGGSTGGGTVAATGALENKSGTNTFAAAVAMGSASATISSDANTLTLTGTISTGTNASNTLTFTGSGNTSVGSTGNAISGSGGLAKTGTGTLTLAKANTYTGATSITGGTVLATDNSASATGTNSVGVSGSSTVLGGKAIIGGAVTLSSGGTLYSGLVASGTPATGAGSGMTLNNTLAVNSANLTFDLSTGNVTGATFSNPNTSTTYLTANGVVSFSGTDSITLVDLTDGALTLRQSQPYLLIKSTLTGDMGFSGLVTENSAGVISMDGDGYVLGVSSSSGVDSAQGFMWNPITFTQLGSTGVSALSDPYPGALQLYLNQGDLEVVPEPSTWALMIGGFALLVVIQRRRARV